MAKGRMPNHKKLAEMGTTSEAMLGAHPTMTPPNWASMATGAWPGTHGITCYWNHTLGNPLEHLDYAFNSTLCKSEYIWNAAARVGKKSILFNYPTSWPPTERNHSIVVDGTGITVNRRAVADNERIYEYQEGIAETKLIPHFVSVGGAFCVMEGEEGEQDFIPTSGEEGINFQVAPDGLVATLEEPTADQFVAPILPAKGWNRVPESKLAPKEMEVIVNSGVESRFGLLLAKGGKKYDTLEIYPSKSQMEKPLAVLHAGEWSGWIYDRFQKRKESIPVAYKIKVMEMNGEGSKLRMYMSFANDLNDNRWYYPERIGEELTREAGPILHQSQCDFHDIRVETQRGLYEWYADSLKYLTKKYRWDILYIHVHAIDYANHMYQNFIMPEHNKDYETYFEMLAKYYEINDRFVGEMLTIADKDTLVFVVSDHGGMSRAYRHVAPIGDPHGVGGKLLEDLGFLAIKRENGKPVVDWSKTRAIAQRSGFIYVNVKGRDPQGIVDPADLPQTIEEIIEALYNYTDPKTGHKPINFALRRADMPILGLYGENVGDIYFTINPGWVRIHGTQLTTASYGGTSVGCVFMMAGPGIKRNHVLKRPVRVVDIVPTICYATDIPVPQDAEGGIIYQAFEE